MKVLFLTNEYPPEIYGGAGIHVGYLTRELAKRLDVEVRAFGSQHLREPRLRVDGFPNAGDPACPQQLRSIFGALRRCVDFCAAGTDADLVHCHTWYTHFAGIAARLNYGIPLVITVHSLEPLRPWKREQLGGGYDFSVWVEKTALEMADAVIAVSEDTRRDIERLFNIRPERLRVIHNGIDLEAYRPTDRSDALEKYGIPPGRPFVLFVGRITRQKGIIHLVNAIRHMNRDFDVVLCAGAPDTPEIAAEMRDAVGRARAERDGIIWIEEMVSRADVKQLYSHAALFVCPSIYEPFGIINLEAMACGTAVVGAAVGGIKEVVVHGETGLLVPVAQMAESPFEPTDPARYSRDLADAVNSLMADPRRRESMAAAGRRRAEQHFGWPAIADRTAELYASLVRR